MNSNSAITLSSILTETQRLEMANSESLPLENPVLKRCNAQIYDLEEVVVERSLTPFVWPTGTIVFRAI